MEHFERRARLAEDRLTEVLAAYRQVKTENEGFRERVTRDMERQFDRRHEKLLLKFIDILDNLDRALEAAEQTYAGNPLIEGLILVRTQLLQTLQHEGLERIPVLGLPYDPAFSEAVGTQAVEDPEHDHVVVHEVLRGYRLHGRVARASRVVVGQHRRGSGGGASRAGRGADRRRRGPGRARRRSAEITAADTVPLDETTLREIFGNGDARKPEPTSSSAEPAALEHVGEREADLRHHHHQVHVRPRGVVLGERQLLGLPHEQVDGVDPVEDEGGRQRRRAGRGLPVRMPGAHADRDQQEGQHEEGRDHPGRLLHPVEDRQRLAAAGAVALDVGEVLGGRGARGRRGRRSCR